MKEEPDISNINLLISKYLSGNATDSESEELMQWLEASSENCEYFAQLKLTWLQSMEETGHPKEFRWEQLKSKIKQKEATNLKMEEIMEESKARIFRTLGYAASVIIIAGISVLLFVIAKPKENIELSQNIIEVPYGSKSSLILPDGTKLWINSGTKLSYNNNYGKNNRDINLSGEAYFDVAKNRKLPFIVHTANLKIKALGTAFNVKAYPEEKKVETTLVHGLVEIEKFGTKNPILLRPSQKIVIGNNREIKRDDNSVEQSNEKTDHTSAINKTSPEVILNKKIDTEKETSWKDGKLIFDREPLMLLAIKLERRYDVQISFANEDLKHYKYTGTFKDLSLEQIMEAMHFSSPVDFEIEGKEVLLKDKIK